MHVLPVHVLPVHVLPVRAAWPVRRPVVRRAALVPPGG
ncbi:hypothetical protein FRACA_1330014 [Frankia canadensis]|uniref:Uncharacterized protein n=1 Tax=Frankia canadensis TaxID=1836972 RepID=A0A2I2KKX0_9ACTN|nr:hypothetical protein FRACA_1330014 [Frankia canadensis]SOU53584.1 hypothetical protein FRACA_1330014 [Frankia canadensis]